jgi:hypothetical protein
MKALVWYGDFDVRYEDAPDPEPADGEVLLDVELAGICGSDLHGYRGHPGPRVPPLVLGHEVVDGGGGVSAHAVSLVGGGRSCGREDNPLRLLAAGRHNRPGVSPSGRPCRGRPSCGLAF